MTTHADTPARRSLYDWLALVAVFSVITLSYCYIATVGELNPIRAVYEEY